MAVSPFTLELPRLMHSTKTNKGILFMKSQLTTVHCDLSKASIIEAQLSLGCILAEYHLISHEYFGTTDTCKLYGIFKVTCPDDLKRMLAAKHA